MAVGIVKVDTIGGNGQYRAGGERDLVADCRFASVDGSNSQSALAIEIGVVGENVELPRSDEGGILVRSGGIIGRHGSGNDPVDRNHQFAVTRQSVTIPDRISNRIDEAFTQSQVEKRVRVREIIVGAVWKTLEVGA